MSRDPELDAHKEWIGYLQPVGLVVSPPALQRAQIVASRNVLAEQDTLQRLITPFGPEELASVPSLRTLLEELLRWRPDDLVEPPEGLEVVLPAYHDTLRPSFAVPDPEHPGRWIALVQVLPTGADMDRADLAQDGWRASPQERLERAQRELDIPVGLVFNGLALRLVYAPRGETSGHLTFPIQAMTEVSGRPILSGMLCLLDADCVFSPDKHRRLSTLLVQSRKDQATVSNALAGQVLEALHELLRGVQAADAAANGKILQTITPDRYDHLYAGLVTVLMRLVFVLYAEDRELLPKDPVYQRHYSVGGLYERLRGDAGLYPDTMDQRYGAWAHLLALFRLIHDGGRHAGLSLPARNGDLFNPDRYPFLEGRPYGVARVMGARFEAPKISDGVIWRVLKNLLMLTDPRTLETERLSYRTLDVEQIGSVYEAIMGFGVERALGPAIGVKPKHIVVDLNAVLKRSGAERARLFAEDAECKLPPAVAAAVAAARTPDDLIAALGARVSPYTPTTLPPGALYLQPGEERRRSGSHYTPRELTGPIVRTTLRPIFEAMGPTPTPEQLLSLKVCDPAMGSGAFLVEACRQLAEKLVESWEVHGRLPEIPADEEPLLHARRKVAQTCLYGVDKNPMAASLAKLSLWLVTLARDHAFTFLDHALKHGDSLVGLTRLQIASFQWTVEGAWSTALFSSLSANLGKAKAGRLQIHALGDDHEREVREAYDEAEQALREARLRGDLLVAAFFDADKPKAREERRQEYVRLWKDASEGSLAAAERVLAIVAALRGGARPVPPFHWEVEFPEVFDRENPGFDCMVGNPPFLGGTRVSTVSGMEYFSWLTDRFPPAGHLCDLVAYFFRRAFDMLADGGTLGLVGTNTIAQGDTRAGGLATIIKQGGHIYSATRRMVWPGAAAVIVSVVHIRSGKLADSVLDGRPVERITAYLFHAGGSDDPARFAALGSLFSAGSKIYGQGFVFSDMEEECTPIRVADELVSNNPKLGQRILPYLGGEEINTHPAQKPHRRVIFLSDIKEESEAWQWPELAEIAYRKVKPGRDLLGSNPNNIPLKKRWWAYQAHRPEFYASISGYRRFIVTSQVSAHWVVGFATADTIISQTVIGFVLHSNAALCMLQSRPHEVWARFFGSSMKDDLRYTPSDCFETFPFPPDWQSDPTLESAGQAYYEFRAALMLRNNEGLTATYNRFHDPDETHPDILELRRLHAAMDRAVLSAYGWGDIPTDCAFLLDYEEPEDEADEGVTRRKKKPWRLRWPDEVRDEVLARLLELNRQRAEAERAAKLTGQAPPPKPRAPKAARPTPKAKPKAKPTLPGLFEPRDEG